MSLPPPPSSAPPRRGGAIELSILSRHYGRVIAAYDIQTTRVDRYGEGEPYAEQVLLLYDGLHYDALVETCFEGAPEDVDTAIFPLGGPRAALVGAKAEALVEKLHRARAFTNTATFALRCATCRKGLVGQKEAVEHAKETGHQNFGEYRD